MLQQKLEKRKGNVFGEATVSKIEYLLSLLTKTINKNG
jgi:hypothetical protein